MIIFMVHSRVCALSWMQWGKAGSHRAVVYWVSSLCLIPHIFYIVLSYKLIIRYHFQCPHPNPSHCEGFCTTFSKSFASFGSNVPFLSARSRILSVVELDLAEMACVSPNVRTTRTGSFASFGSNVPFLSARSRILFSLPLVALVFYIYSLILVGWWYVGIYVPC